MLSVHQTWDPLKVCCVGRGFPPHFFDYIKDGRVRDVFHRIAEETEEDLLKLCSMLEGFGVKVIRTDVSDNPEDYFAQGTFEGTVTGRMYAPPLTPRDHTAMIGNKFFMPSKNYGDDIDVEQELKNIFGSSATQMRNASDFHKELLAYVYDLTYPGRPVSPATQHMMMNTIKYIKKGNIKAFLEHIDVADLKELIMQAHTNTIGSNTKYANNKNNYAYETLEKFLQEEGTPIVYDEYINSATTTRVGKDLFFGYNNIIAKLKEDVYMKKWKRLFPDHRIRPVNLPGHVDGAFTPVKPGLILSLRVGETYAETFPDWEVVYLEGESWGKMESFLKAKEKTKGRYWVPGEEQNDAFYEYVNTWMNDWVTYVEETVFDVNMLVIDEHNVICNGYNKIAFDAFERHGVTPHVLNFRHRYFWDGGLHCITSDIAREGEQKDFFGDV